MRDTGSIYLKKPDIFNATGFILVSGKYTILKVFHGRKGSPVFITHRIMFRFDPSKQLL